MKKILLLCLWQLPFSSLFAQNVGPLLDQYQLEFDQKLDDPLISSRVLETKAYIKLQIARREFADEIHNNKQHNNERSLSDIDKWIDSEADKIKLKQDSYRLLFQKSDDIIYASTEKQGNVTGAEYPDKTWSLTFDDGPHDKITPKVLDALNLRNIKATFFMVGNAYNIWPHTGNLVKQENMEIASHSYTHAALGKAGANLNKEIKGAKFLLQEKMGVDIELMRLPYGDGVYHGVVRKTMAENELIHIFWNVDSLDWNDQNSKSVFERVKKQVEAIAMHSKKDAGIILFHDRKEVTPAASALVMDYLKTRKVNFCTVGAVIEQINKGTSTCN